MSNERPMEDQVTDDFTDSIDTEVVQRIGYGLLRPYAWADDDECEWPFVVVRDGREFEVDIDVRVVELTDEVKARRRESHERIETMLRERGIAP